MRAAIVPETIKKFFHPRSDITVHELALLLANLLMTGPVFFTEDEWNNLQWGFKRHFSETRPKIIDL